MRGWISLLLAAGCSGPGPDDEGPKDDAGDDDDTTGDDDDDDTTGDDDDDDTSDFNGPFALVSLVGYEILGSVNTTVSSIFYDSVPTPTGTGEPIPIDTCEWSTITSTTPTTPTTPTTSTTSTTPTTTLTLLDAGEVEIALDGEVFEGYSIEGWPGGQTLSFSASGSADFPAFDVPDFFVVPEDLGAVTVNDAEDGSIEVTWSGGAGGDDVFMIIGLYWYDDGTYASCFVEDDGAFTVPAEFTGTGTRFLTVLRSSFFYAPSDEVDVIGSVGFGVSIF